MVPHEQGPRIAVYGLGNVLMTDDAFGPRVVHELFHRYRFPREVALEDLGTPGLDLAPFLLDIEAVVLVDTVLGDGPPGTLVRHGRESLLTTPLGLRLGPHDPSLTGVLRSLEIAGRAPREIVLVGAIPGATGRGTSLTPALAAAVPLAVEKVVAEVARLGFHAQPVGGAASVPRPWWEREPDAAPV